MIHTMLRERNIKSIMIMFVFVTGLYQWQLVLRLNYSYQRNHSQNNTCVKKQYAYHAIGYAINSADDYKKIKTLIQDKLYDLQNPQNCISAQKVVCALPPTGFGSQVHLLTICFTIGFMMKRTVILQTHESKYDVSGWDDLFLPLSVNCTTSLNQTVHEVLSLYNTESIQVIKAVYETFYFDLERTLPADFRRDIKRFHSDPQLWWAGQLASYILRPTDRLNHLLVEKKKSLGFTNTIVGLHIRRTDKLSEANYYNLTEYMEAADNWFDEYENKSKASRNKRKIFIATDEPKVVAEAKKMFPDYIFINDINVTTDANKRGMRYRYSSLVGIVIDTFLLSMCDYIVCTMTSNICRLAFELMQTRYEDASTHAKSLDCEYYIQKLYKRHCRLRPTKLSAVEKMIKNVI